MFHKTYIDLEQAKKGKVLPGRFFVRTTLFDEDAALDILSLQQKGHQILGVCMQEISAKQSKERHFKGTKLLPKTLLSTLSSLRYFIIAIPFKDPAQSMNACKKTLDMINRTHDKDSTMVEIEWELSNNINLNKDMFAMLVSAPLDRITFIFSEAQLDNKELIQQVQGFIDICVEEFIWPYTRNLPFCKNPEGPEHVQELFDTVKKGRIAQGCAGCVMQDLCGRMFTLPQTFSAEPMNRMEHLGDIKNLKDMMVKNARHHTY